MPQPYPGQQWRHGWIPVTPAAVRSKNHGRKPGGKNSKVSEAAAAAGAVLKRMDAKDAAQPPGGKAPTPARDARSLSRQVDDAIRKAAGRQPEPAAKTMQVPQSAKPFHRNLDGIQDLAESVENGFPPKQTRPLGGGMVAQVDLLTLKDGKQVVRKSTRLSNGGVQDADGEQVASLVAHALGIDAPRVYRKDDKSIYMDYVADAETGESIRSRGDTEKFGKAMASDDGKLIGLLDVLTFNYDRNAGNWLLTRDGRVIPIDHGVAYTESLDIERGQHLDFLNDFADHYKGPNPLTKADVAETRRRLNSLRADFAHIGKLPWWKHSMQALDDLEANAAGTRNLIAGVR